MIDHILRMMKYSAADESAGGSGADKANADSGNCYPLSLENISLRLDKREASLPSIRDSVNAPTLARLNLITELTRYSNSRNYAHSPRGNLPGRSNQ